MSILKNNFWLSISLLSTAMLTMMANAVIAPSLPQISKIYSHIEHIELLSKMLMTLPALTVALSAFFVGYIVDEYGRLKVLFISFIIYLLAGTSGIWIEGFYPLLISRFILGFAMAGIMTASTTLLGDYFQPVERNEFVSIQGAFMGFGGLLFIGFAGYLADIGWRYPFYIYSFAIIVFILVLKNLHEPKINKPNKATHEKVTYNKKSINLLLVITFVGMAAFYVIPVQIPFLLKEMGIESNFASGMALSAFTFSQAIFSLFYKKIKAKLSFPSITGLSFLFIGLGYFAISQSGNYTFLLLSIFVAAFGTGFMLPNQTLWLMDIAPASIRGRLTGKSTMSAFIGLFMSPFITQPLIDNYSVAESFMFVSLTLICMFIPFGVYSLRERFRS